MNKFRDFGRIDCDNSVIRVCSSLLDGMPDEESSDHGGSQRHSDVRQWPI